MVRSLLLHRSIHWRPVQQRADTLVVAHTLQIGIQPRECAVFGICRDRLLQIAYRVWQLAALRETDGNHVERLIVAGVLAEDVLEVLDGLIGLTRVERDSGGV